VSVAGGPVIQITGLLKKYQALRPLRIASLDVAPGDRFVLGGLDEAAAEMLVHLITGAALPDEGTIVVGGRHTRDIATDTEWLTSLDRFGMVTHRAVLLEGMSLLANLALPLTLEIDPVPATVRARVQAIADDVGFSRNRLEAPAGDLTAEERLRVHLGRALALGPELLLLEHPTAPLGDAAAATRVGETLRALGRARGLGWLALSEDDAFAKAVGGTRLRLAPATGQVTAATGWRRWLP
jgi:ABC-type methionine transport system ATPase subunit